MSYLVIALQNENFNSLRVGCTYCKNPLRVNLDLNQNTPGVKKSNGQELKRPG